MRKRKDDNRCIECRREFESSSYKGRRKTFCNSTCGETWHEKNPDFKSVYDYLKTI